MLMQFHHIGYAVKEISATAKFYVKNGWTLTEEMVDTIQNTHIAFLKREGFPLIELVSPVDNNSPVVNLLDKSGVTPYHLCYSVCNIEDAIAELRKDKFLPLFNPVDAIALGNRKICYLYNKNVGLIELVEA